MDPGRACVACALLLLLLCAEAAEQQGMHRAETSRPTERLPEDRRIREEGEQIHSRIDGARMGGSFPMLQTMGICYLADYDLRQMGCKHHCGVARAELKLEFW